MKYNIDQIEMLLDQMRNVKSKHPEANVYFDWQNNEIRITYPVPFDLKNLIHSSHKDSYQLPSKKKNNAKQ